MLGDRTVGDQQWDRGGQCLDQDTERGKTRRRAEHRADEDFGQFGFTVEEHFAFVGEVAEVGAFGDPGARRDLGSGGLVVAAFEVELQSRVARSRARALLPSRGMSPSYLYGSD